MSITQKFKTLTADALATVDDATELDENLIKFLKSKQSKLRFFWKAGRSTVILLASIPALAGLAIGILAGYFFA